MLRMIVIVKYGPVAEHLGHALPLPSELFRLYELLRTVLSVRDEVQGDTKETILTGPECSTVGFRGPDSEFSFLRLSRP